MASHLETIRDEVRRYIEREIQLYELEDCLTPMLWDIDARVEPKSTALLGRIHILTTEYSRRDRTEESMRRELESAIRPLVRIFSTDTIRVTLSPPKTASVNIAQPASFSLVLQ